jgi:hypothetical protein
VKRIHAFAGPLTISTNAGLAPGDLFEPLQPDRTFPDRNGRRRAFARPRALRRLREALVYGELDPTATALGSGIPQAPPVWISPCPIGAGAG